MHLSIYAYLNDPSSLSLCFRNRHLKEKENGGPYVIFILSMENFQFFSISGIQTQTGTHKHNRGKGGGGGRIIVSCVLTCN